MTKFKIELNKPSSTTGGLIYRKNHFLGFDVYDKIINNNLFIYFETISQYDTRCATVTNLRLDHNYDLIGEFVFMDNFNGKEFMSLYDMPCQFAIIPYGIATINEYKEVGDDFEFYGFIVSDYVWSSHE